MTLLKRLGWWIWVPLVVSGAWGLWSHNTWAVLCLALGFAYGYLVAIRKQKGESRS